MNTAFDEIDFEYATVVADRATRSMSKQGVPPTPNNFEVWFNYSLGASTNLRRAIDILISNKRKFDASVNRELFLTYVRSDTPEISGQIQTVISGAREYLKTAIADHHTQILELGEVSSQAKSSNNPKVIIERLVNELSRAAMRASTLESNFAKTSEEMDKIRDSLQQAEKQSNTDTLTGLANRRAIDEFFRAAQIVSMEQGEPLSILLIDVDHFKKFNDNFGHQVGDQVLRLISKVLRERVRECDLPARYGGEELIVVLPGMDLRTSQGLAEHIRRTIAECHITRRSTGEAISSITVSIGVAQFKLGESIESLIERCDRALYLAKGSGRNRTATESELDRDLTAGKAVDKPEGWFLGRS